MRTKLKMLLGLSMALLTGLSLAQSAPWPDRPIKIVVGFAAGTAPDIFARLYGEFASRKLGVPVVIENKPGAAGNLATDAVAKAPADGYTFLYALSAAFTINPLIFSRLPFDPQKDLVPVATTMRQGLVLIASPGLAAKSAKDLVAAAKASPGTISHASYGVGTPSHLIMEWFKGETGIDMVHVPYRGSPIPDLLGGHVDTLMEPIATAFPLINSGKVQALAYSGPARFAALPDVPTLSELVPGLTMMSWHGIWAPSATPAAIVDRVHAVFVEGSKDADVQRKIRELTAEPLGVSRTEMANMVRRDADVYGRIVRAQNIRVE